MITSLKNIASNFVPEWDLDTKYPDLGTAFAMVFAEMMEEIEIGLEDIMDYYYQKYTEYINLNTILCRNAMGYITFTLMKKVSEGQFIPKNTILYNQDQIAYQTDTNLYLNTADLMSVYYTFGKEDKIIKFSNDIFNEPWIFHHFNEDENIQEHCLYICYYDILDKISSDFCIIIDFDLKSGWSFLKDLKVIEWSYSSDEFIEFSSAKWIEKQLRLKIEENKLFKKKKLFDREGYFIKAKVVDIKKAELIQINQLYLSVNCEDKIKPRHIYHQNTELSLLEPFQPYGQILIPNDIFNIACDNVLLMENILITLEADVAFKVCKVNNIWENYLEKVAGGQIETPQIKITQVALEYWNDYNFVALQTQQSPSSIFEISEQQSMSFNTLKFETRTIQFICPSNLKRTFINGVESLWLRIRLIELSDINYGFGEYIYPVFDNMRFIVSQNRMENKDKSSNLPIKYDELVAVNNRSVQKFLNCNSIGKVFFSIGINKPSLFLGFNKDFIEYPCGMLWEPEIIKKEDMPEISFYMYTKSGWEKADILDGTNRFSNTGIIQLSFDRNTISHMFFNEMFFWVRIEFDTSKMELPLKLLGFWNNSSSITQIEGGELGNCDINNIVQFDSSLDKIQSVTNPFPMFGAKESESEKERMIRSTNTIRHRGWAVTKSDFEALAYESVGILLKCKCFVSLGYVTLIFVPQQYENTHKPSNEIAIQIKKFLLNKSHPMFEGENRLTVMEAIYLPITVKADIILSQNVTSIEGKKYLELVINKFLNPISGNFKGIGFEIGEFPDWDNLYYFIHNQSIVNKIVKLDMQIIKLKSDQLDFSLPIPGKIILNIMTTKEVL